MTQSMTGYARTETQHDGLSLTWEIRSINHRYLETHWRMPEDFRALEPALRQLAAKHISRGKLDCQLHVRGSRNHGEPLNIDQHMLAHVAHAARDVAEMLGDNSAINPLDVLRWPGVVQDTSGNMEPLHQQATTLFSDTLKQLAENRSNEGERLAGLITSRLESLTGWVTETRKRVPEIRALLAERLQKKLDAIEVAPDSSRLEQELVIQAAKMDVDEELDRLDGHIKEIGDVLKRKEPVGRRLDFLMQELNREANTLGSKSQHIDTTRASVEAKVLIEQMREQIQNIE